MLNVIVGENSSGKTLYLDYLYMHNDCSYNRMSTESMLRDIDVNLLNYAYPDAEVRGKEICLIDSDADSISEVTRIMNIMFRKSDILLLDEIDATLNETDKYLVYRAVLLIARKKPVYAVTHDEDLTFYADAVYTVRDGELVTLTREETLQEIYQDEEMAKV